jgi:hypothetical protein
MRSLGGKTANEKTEAYLQELTQRQNLNQLLVMQKKETLEAQKARTQQLMESLRTILQQQKLDQFQNSYLTEEEIQRIEEDELLKIAQEQGNRNPW